MSASLDGDDEGTLAARIRTLYPVAMIDEFQDTDPLQYSIFSRIYLPHPQCGLFMIGDPKQAIYGFAAQTFYLHQGAQSGQCALHARHQLALQRRYGRGGESDIHPAGQPVYLRQRHSVFAVSASPKAGGRAWLLNGEVQPALTYWSMAADAPVTKGAYLDTMAAATASQIQTILTAAQQGQAQFTHGGAIQACDSIQAGDIAVLVRTGNEGRLIKDALAQQGIASVYLSNRDSVFTSTIAPDMQRLLQRC